MSRICLIAVVLLAGCQQEDAPAAAADSLDFPGFGASKFDVFGRALAGVAAPYPADSTLNGEEARLQSDMAFRRQTAWDIVERVIEPVPLLGLAETTEGDVLEQPDSEGPTVPRYETWYGVDDIKRLFRHLLDGLSPVERATRAPFTEAALDEAFDWNAAALDRSNRWPLERFLKHVTELGICDKDLEPDECAQSLQSNFSGATSGTSRMAYSPATVRHLLKNYKTLSECRGVLDTLALGAQPAAETNFTACMTSEMPHNAVLIKAHWIRADFGKKMPAFNTDGATLANILGDDKSANWGDGDRQVDPTPAEVVTIRARNGNTFRLAGLHIMTKELRHWTWITLWWSDQPTVDFGADRPASISGAWAQYKMGVTVDYEEADPDVSSGFEAMPTLAAALNATRSSLTWSSNPYIEHGRGNARTNCIGCHQHGGATTGFDLDGESSGDTFELEAVITDETHFPGNGRAKIRDIFPADYLWSTQRVDSLASLMRGELDRLDRQDEDDPDVRVTHIQALTGDPVAGAEVFQTNCTVCHGGDGLGTPSGPPLAERVPKLDAATMLKTIVTGRSPMPSWAHLSNPELAHVGAFLRQTFSEEIAP